jgi:hypothetical protein
MPEKNKSKKVATKALVNGNKMASISQDNRTLAEKAKSKALFEARKKKEEGEGADFETPQYLQEQTKKRRENLMRSAAVGASAGLLALQPVLAISTPGVPSVMAATADLASKIIPKEKQKGELYEAISSPKIKKIASKSSYNKYRKLGTGKEK